MGRERRVKQRHDPSSQREEDESPSSPPRHELCPRHRPGKEPAGSSSQAPPARTSRQPRRAPYMMQGMPNPPPAQISPQRRGIAHDICPRTPPRLQVEYAPDQRRYESYPRLARPQHVEGFAIEMPRNYSG